MHTTINATLTAARSAEATLVRAIHGAADALDAVGQDPLADAVARLRQSAEAAQSRLHAGRLLVAGILADALAGFEVFEGSFTTTLTPNGSESPALEATETTPNDSESERLMGIPECVTVPSEEEMTPNGSESQEATVTPNDSESRPEVEVEEVVQVTAANPPVAPPAETRDGEGTPAPLPKKPHRKGARRPKK